MYHTRPQPGFGYAFGVPWHKKISRAAKKTGKAVGKAAVTVAKTAADVAMLPIKLQIEAVNKLILPIAKMVAQLPEPVLVAAAHAANVADGATFVNIFRTAAKANDITKLKRNLPVILRIGIQLGAQGAFPPIVPVMRTLSLIPDVVLRAVQLGPLIPILKGRSVAKARATLPQSAPPPAAVAETAVDDTAPSTPECCPCPAPTEQWAGALMEAEAARLSNTGHGILLGISLLGLGAGIYGVTRNRRN